MAYRQSCLGSVCLPAGHCRAPCSASLPTPGSVGSAHEPSTPTSRFACSPTSDVTWVTTSASPLAGVGRRRRKTWVRLELAIFFHAAGLLESFRRPFQYSTLRLTSHW